MEFQGRISKVFEPQSGKSQRTGNDWKTQEFEFEYFETNDQRYPDRVVLQTFDTSIMEQLEEGAECTCGFYHNTRDYNGKKYNELRMYKFERKDKPQAPQQPAQPQKVATAASSATPPQAPAGEKKDNLPF